jgi:hypothetical protein
MSTTETRKVAGNLGARLIARETKYQRGGSSSSPADSAEWPAAISAAASALRIAHASP